MKGRQQRVGMNDEAGGAGSMKLSPAREAVAGVTGCNEHRMSTGRKLPAVDLVDRPTG
jgi:hypothetical protein